MSDDTVLIDYEGLYSQEDMDREIARSTAAEAQVDAITEALREVEWDDVLNCVEAAMNDRCEPERYRESYTKAYAAVTKLAALSEGGEGPRFDNDATHPLNDARPGATTEGDE